MIVLRTMLLLLVGLLLSAAPADAGYVWDIRGANEIIQPTERNLVQSDERVSYSPFGEVRHHPLGDLNGDGAVNNADQQILFGNWGNPGIGDLNQDGVVNNADLNILNGQWTNPAHPAGTLSTDGNTIGFTAHIYDVESGLLLARFRVYDAQLGRWLSPDPAGFVDGMNLYLYVRGNPLLWWDPMGLVPKPVGTRATWTETGVDYSLSEKMGGVSVLRLRRICGEGTTDRWLLERLDGLFSFQTAQALLAWALENWDSRGLLEYGPGFRKQLADRMNPQATEAEHTQREINEARAQAAEDLQPFIDALRTGGEIGISLVPGGGIAVFLGTPNLMNAAAMIPISGAAARVVGGAADVARGAAKNTPKLLGPRTSFGAKIEGQLSGRGWTKELVQSAIDRPARTVRWRDTRRLPDGGRMDDPATAYYSQRGEYVVRNDRTGDIVQVSDRIDVGWRAPWD